MDKQQADSATAMRDVSDRWRDIALSEVSHQDVTGDGQPVAWWWAPGPAVERSPGVVVLEMGGWRWSGPRSR